MSLDATVGCVRVTFSILVHGAAESVTPAPKRSDKWLSKWLVFSCPMMCVALTLSPLAAAGTLAGRMAIV